MGDHHFISYSRPEASDFVTVLCDELEASSPDFRAWFDQRDRRPGGNFVLEMQKAATGTHKTIAVLSDNYLHAEYTHPEWAAAFARDPQGQQRTLIPMRVQECTPQGLLGPIQ